jgi:hypothetical protein
MLKTIDTSKQSHSPRRILHPSNPRRRARPERELIYVDGIAVAENMRPGDADGHETDTENALAGNFCGYNDVCSMRLAATAVASTQ